MLHPLKVVAMTKEGVEHEIGTYSQGVVADGCNLVDVAGDNVLASFCPEEGDKWSVVGDDHYYDRVFIQATN